MIEGEELSCLARTLPYLVCDEEDVVLLTEIIHGCLTLLAIRDTQGFSPYLVRMQFPSTS